jgi:PilZ domain
VILLKPVVKERLARAGPAPERCVDCNAITLEESGSEMEKTSGSPVQQSVADRRKHKRYQYVERVVVRRKDGKVHVGTSFEISQGGMSAVFPNIVLEIGERVELAPVVGYEVQAVLRHVHKNMYGFEFLELAVEQVKALAEKCKGLPEFKTMLDV